MNTPIHLTNSLIPASSAGLTGCPHVHTSASMHGIDSRKCAAALFAAGMLCTFPVHAETTAAAPATAYAKAEGFRGIWFDLGQKSEFGSKYSDGLVIADSVAFVRLGE